MNRQSQAQLDGANRRADAMAGRRQSPRDGQPADDLAAAAGGPRMRAGPQSTCAARRSARPCPRRSPPATDAWGLKLVTERDAGQAGGRSGASWMASAPGLLAASLIARAQAAVRRVQPGGR